MRRVKSIEITVLRTRNRLTVGVETAVSCTRNRLTVSVQTAVLGPCDTLPIAVYIGVAGTRYALVVAIEILMAGTSNTLVVAVHVLVARTRHRLPIPIYTRVAGTRYALVVAIEVLVARTRDTLPVAIHVWVACTSDALVVAIEILVATCSHGLPAAVEVLMVATARIGLPVPTQATVGGLGTRLFVATQIGMWLPTWLPLGVLAEAAMGGALRTLAESAQILMPAWTRALLAESAQIAMCSGTRLLPTLGRAQILMPLLAGVALRLAIEIIVGLLSGTLWCGACTQIAMRLWCLPLPCILCAQRWMASRAAALLYPALTQRVVRDVAGTLPFPLRTQVLMALWPSRAAAVGTLTHRLVTRATLSLHPLAAQIIVRAR